MRPVVYIVAAYIVYRCVYNKQQDSTTVEFETFLVYLSAQICILYRRVPMKLSKERKNGQCIIYTYKHMYKKKGAGSSSSIHLTRGGISTCGAALNSTLLVPLFFSSSPRGYCIDGLSLELLTTCNVAPRGYMTRHAVSVHLIQSGHILRVPHVLSIQQQIFFKIQLYSFMHKVSCHHRRNLIRGIYSIPFDY